jgi:twitching motility protein PilT
MTFFDLLTDAVKRKASDIHLAVGHPPTYRISGDLVASKSPELTSRSVEQLAREILPDARWKRFLETHELDFAYEDEEHRFRINLHLARGGTALAARIIPRAIPSFDDILLPEPARRLVETENGLILVTGPAGTGKSTTLAAMLGWLNDNHPYHIVTLEDPIEFVFPRSQGIVKQREVGTDTDSFAEGLRRCLRQDPDVIMVGEMRDPETIAAALTLAETGHLVFSTLHTSSSAQAVYRIVDSFQGPQQEQVLRQLSLSLRGVIAQDLLQRKDGGLVAAREILLNNNAVANLIRENKVEQISSVIQTGRSEGMMPMERAIEDLWKGGTISEEVARAHLPSNGLRAGKRR